MRIIACVILFQIPACQQLTAQNVGIDLSNPMKKLSINGSLLIDQGNTNFGTLDSAGLRFGTTSLVGLSSNRSAGGANQNGLDFWTNGVRRLTLTSAGSLGINKSNPVALLDVNGTTNTLYLITGGISSTGSIETDSDLRANDDLFVTDDATIGGNMTVGGAVSSSYKFKVEGNGLFTTNVGIDGTLRVDGKITNEGRALMLSNSGTTLRTGFSFGTFTSNIGAGSFTDITFCITKFEGNNNNVRVMVGQFIPGAGNSGAGCLIFTPIATAATSAICGSGSQTTIRITNACATSASSGTNATLYLMSSVTN